MMNLDDGVRQNLQASSCEVSRPTREDWERLRREIENLYFNERRSLKDVQAYMETNHSLFATKRMYMAKVKQWNIHKNYKACEKEEMLAAVRDSGGSKSLSELTIRGQPVQVDKVRRYSSLKRLHQQRDTATGRSVNISRAARSSLASAALALTGSTIAIQNASDTMPQPASHDTTLCCPLAIPAGAFNLEHLLYRLRALAIHSYRCYAIESGNSRSFWCSIRCGIYLLHVQSPHLGWRQINAACNDAMKLENDDYQHIFLPFVRGLMSTLSPANTEICVGLRRTLIRYLKEIFRSNEDVGFICAQVLQEEFDIDASQCVLNLLLELSQSPEHRCSETFEEAFYTQRALVQLYRHSKCFVAAETGANLLLKHAKQMFGEFSYEACEAMREMAHIYSCQRRYSNALSLYKDLIEVKRVALGTLYPDFKTCYIMEKMAELYNVSGDVDRCLYWLTEALDGTWEQRGGAYQTIHVRDKVQRMLIMLGRDGEAHTLPSIYPADTIIFQGEMRVHVTSGSDPNVRLGTIEAVASIDTEMTPLYDRPAETVC